MQSLYGWDFSGRKADLKKVTEKNLEEFGPGLEDQSLVWQIITGVVKYIKEIDNVIEKAAPEWPIDQITIVDRNVLRIGLFELIYGNKAEVPPKVAINEAIELAKTFGGDSSGKFINGVLGTIYKEMGGSEENKGIPEEFLGGGAVYRIKDGKHQIALVLDIFDHWTFPKGKIERGEKLEEATLREIREETGLKNIRIIKKIGERQYKTKDPDRGLLIKNVSDFLLEAKGDEELKAEKSPGIKDARWFNLDEIPSLKQYDETKEALNEAIEYLKKKNEGL